MLSELSNQTDLILVISWMEKTLKKTKKPQTKKTQPPLVILEYLGDLVHGYFFPGSIPMIQLGDAAVLEVLTFK